MMQKSDACIESYRITFLEESRGKKYLRRLNFRVCLMAPNMKFRRIML